MPKKGVAGRGKVLGTLAGLQHAKMTAAELSDAVEACAAEAPPGSVFEAQAREARRHIERARRIPPRLAKELAEAQSLGVDAWARAREQSDFSLFQKELERLITLAREAAEHLKVLVESGRPYDALLDDYEPGSTEEDLIPLFASLRDSLSPLVKEVGERGVEVDETKVLGSYPSERQLAFGSLVATQMGFDFDAGRIDAAPHPFCTGFSPNDVRLTWRWQEDDFRSALLGIMHEAGHGLYEQGLPDEWRRTPLGNPASLGVHESQSRLWENLVGRSRAFWEWALPHFHEMFSDKQDLTLEGLWPTLHTIRPSLIRVEADEATYNLHVAIRFELERALFAGELEATELPAAWNDLYDELLGVRPQNDAEGVLQDIHWSYGAFGYFPTYTLGNLIMAQLFVAVRSDLGDLDAQLARGELRPLLDWLRDRIHRHGRRYPASELVERATGQPLSADAFLEYVRLTAAEVYGVG